MKRLIREAARIARDRSTSSPSSPLEARLLTIRSISRAVLFDQELAETLLTRVPLASDHMQVDRSTGAVTLQGPVALR
eukprot:2167766-Pyramimonas_sp.AAC.1